MATRYKKKASESGLDRTDELLVGEVNEKRKGWHRSCSQKRFVLFWKIFALPRTLTSWRENRDTLASKIKDPNPPALLRVKLWSRIASCNGCWIY
jgi:hypothetical protein